MLENTRHWVLRPTLPASVLAQFPALSPLIVQLLHNRGVTDGDAMAAFLAATPPETADPLLMHGVAEAVARLGQAAVAQELVAIYGDFDADGVTASALLTEAFAALGIRAVPYIPTRAEGYGLSVAALRSLAEQGIRLIVTVDCGINSVAEVAFAKEAGLDVVVTDHHRIDGALPGAIALINPRQPDCPYPFKQLAAVGVAFQFARAALERLPLVAGYSGANVTARLLDLVALGTVADVAPLLGENRALVRLGLDALNHTPRRGLRALIARAGLRLGALSAGNIAFGLAPRLNAAGRVHDAFAAYRLLLSDAPDEARALAEELEAANQQRQRLMAEALERARALVLAEERLAKLLLVAGSEFPAGIVGLVAGRLAEEFHRPAFVVELGEEECRGSARSIDGFNVAEALASCRDLLIRFGGHAQAAGFTVAPVHLAGLHQRLLAFAGQQLDTALLRPRLLVDAELPLSAVTWGLHDQLIRLAPFGHGNPTPVFLTRGVRVASTRVVGHEPPGHLKFQLHDGERYWPAIAFRMGHAAAQVARRIDIVYTVERNEWEGRQSLELHLKDWRPAT